MNNDYMEFTERVRRNIESATGKTVKLQAVKKNNGVILYGITIFTEGCNMAPTVYLEKFYEMYQDGETMGKIISEIIEFSEHETIHMNYDMSYFEDYDKVKPSLGVKLINADMNINLLQEVPHKRFLNLAIVCYSEVISEKIGCGTILIRNEHLDMWNVKAEDILQEAMKNWQELCPAEIINTMDILKKLYDDPKELIVSKLPLWILTTVNRTFGACALVYDKQLEKLAEEVQDDFYILPSSIHELVILPKKRIKDILQIVEMVRTINRENLDMEEYLAENIYFYNRETKELQIIF